MVNPKRRWCLLAPLPLLLALLVSGEEHDHTYTSQERVVVWADTIGPVGNPSETYSFETSFPICELWESGFQHRVLSFSEQLAGHHYVTSPRIKISFPELDADGKVVSGDTSPNEEVCRMRLTHSIIHQLRVLIENEYMMSYNIDGLPIFGMVGTQKYIPSNVTHEGADSPPTKSSSHLAIYTHKRIILERNADKIVGVTLVSSIPAALDLGSEIRFSYDVVWKESAVPFTSRLDRYAKGYLMAVGDGNRDIFTVSSLSDKIQSMSLFNSMAIAVFLCVSLVVILRHVFDNDKARFSDVESLSPHVAGWRQLSRDVFRRPKHLLLFSLAVGCGAHFETLFGVLLAVSYWRSRSGEFTSSPATVILWWSCLQPVGSYVGVNTFIQCGGRRWKNASVWQLLITPILVAFIFLQLNTVSLVYGASVAAPVSVVLKLIFMFALINVPLHLLTLFVLRVLKQSSPSSKKLSTTDSGLPPIGVTSKTSSIISGQPPNYRFNALERPIPKLSTFRNMMRMCEPFAIGLVPFSTLMIEIHFILSAFWSPVGAYQMCATVISALFLHLCTLICLSAVAVYFLLDSEDHRWIWYSFCCGASTGLYVMLASVLFFVKVSAMTGVLQQLHFFAVTGVASAAVGLGSGVVSFGSANWLVKRMYSAHKAE